MPTKTKPKGKAKSASTGRYVKRGEATANPREVFLEGKGDEKAVRLGLAQLRILLRVFDQGLDHDGYGQIKYYAQIRIEILRAIAAHERKVKK